MTQPAKKTAAARVDRGGKPLDPNDDMQLEVVDDDDTRGLDNAIKNSDAGDRNENIR